MSFSHNFVTSIKCNGRFIEPAADNTCAIPFNSEYEIYLVNKNNRRAVARVFVDEENVSEGGLVVHPHQPLTLDCNVTTKDKFLFVSQESFAAAVAGKSVNINRRNGVIRVEWTLEKEREVPIYTHNPTRKPWKGMPPYSEPWFIKDAPTYGSLKSASRGIDDASSTESLCAGEQHSNTRSNCQKLKLYDSPPTSEGCTVSGNRSDASFRSVYVDLENTPPVVITLVLRGFESQPAVIQTSIYCPGCGTKWRQKAKFCSQCGRSKD